MVITSQAGVHFSTVPFRSQNKNTIQPFYLKCYKCLGQFQCKQLHELLISGDIEKKKMNKNKGEYWCKWCDLLYQVTL